MHRPRTARILTCPSPHTQTTHDPTTTTTNRCSLGYAPTTTQLAAIGLTKRRLWGLADMQVMVRDAFPRHKNPSGEIIKAFKYYNATFRGIESRMIDGDLVVEDDDEIPVRDLEHLMTQMGDVLNATEWINLAAKGDESINPRTGCINYRRLVLGIC
jgi:hypothetical protein